MRSTRPRIIKIARKYRSLSPIFGEEDLQQEALIAILQALRKYKHSPDIRMKFSTYLEWSIRNIFQRAIGNRDKYVEIYRRVTGRSRRPWGTASSSDRRRPWKTQAAPTRPRNGSATFRKSSGTRTWRRSWIRQASPPMNTLQDLRKNPRRCGRQRTGEQEEGEEAREEPEISARGNGSGSYNGLNLQMIDGLYRQWARTRSVVNESDPLVLRIYDLCRQDSEAFSLPPESNGSLIGADEVERSALSAIVRSLARHDDSVPKIPFSMCLRVAMKRSMETLRKDGAQKGGVPQWTSET